MANSRQLDRKEAERAFTQGQDLYRTLVEALPEAMLLTDLRHHVIMANHQALKLYGYRSIKEMAGKNAMDFIAPEDRPAARQDAPEWTIAGEPRGKEYKMISRDGFAFPAEVRGFLIRDTEDQPRAIITLVRDISERKKAEDQIKASLREKDALLKEIHHRVKNNLQVISSLLHLQCRYIKDEDARRVFKETQNRVWTMGLIHEKLYQSQDLTRINLAAYIRGLVAGLASAYDVIPGSKTGFRFEMADIFLEINKAVPCGLIVNELVSNALKYAFPGEGRGEILIGLRPEAGEVELRIRDNGVGFPRELDFRKMPSLGLQLVTNLVQQLDGRIELNREGGSEFVITFPGQEETGMAKRIHLGQKQGGLTPESQAGSPGGKDEASENPETDRRAPKRGFAPNSRIFRALVK